MVTRDAPARAWWIRALGEHLRRDQRRACWVGMLAAMSGATAVAALRPFWFDEIFTWQIASRPTVSELVAVLGPMDPSPPLHYLLVRGAHALFGTGLVATRLPALVSFLLTLMLLHRLVLPVAGPLFAFVVVGTLLLTPALDLASEARPYALLLACSALSLVAWQEVTSGRRRRLGMAALLGSLTAALYAHFYGFLLFFPIATGEAVRTWARRRFDLAVWATLALAGLLALPLLSLVQECMAVRATFWAAPNLSGFAQSLQMFRGPVLVALIAAALTGIARYGARGGQASREPPCLMAPVHEVAAAAVLACVPLIVFLLATLATNAYDARYIYPALLGVLLLLAHGSRWLRHRRTDIATVLLAVVCLLGSARVFLGVRRSLVEPPTPVPLPLPADGPRFVVVANPFAFVQTVHAAPETMDRVVYLVDDLAKSDRPRSSPDISVLGLRALLPLQVHDFVEFAATHERFWVFDAAGTLGARLGAIDDRAGGALTRAPDRLQLWSR